MSAQKISSQLYRELLDRSDSIICIIERTGAIRYVNEAWRQFAQVNGLQVKNYRGLNYLDVCEHSGALGDQYALHAEAGIQQVVDGEKLQFFMEYPCHSPDQHRWFLMRVFPLTNIGERLFVIFHDQLLSSSEDQASLRRVTTAACAGEVGIWELDLDTASLQWNPDMYQIHGLPEDKELMDFGCWMQILHPDDRYRVEAQFFYTVHTQTTLNTEFRLLQEGGSVRHIMIKAKCLPVEKNKAQKLVGIGMDITFRKLCEEKEKELAYRDPLTGLPNRKLFADRMNQAQKMSERSDWYGALLFIDLDNFKIINDTAGHSTGDLMLKQVAERLTHCLREEDTLCRQGGDEFLVLLPDVGKSPESAANSAKQVSNKILSACYKPFQLKGGYQQITASIGVTLFNGHFRESDILIKEADLAMYEAKSAGRNTFRFFSATLQSEIDYKVETELALNRALEMDQLRLCYQPMAGANGNCHSAEALLRWEHPRLGLLQPNKFLPVAEDCGLILGIGEWVIRSVFEQVVRWSEDPAMEKVSVSINLSIRQIKSPHFTRLIREIVEQTEVNPKRIKLEFTENVLLEDTEEICSKMQQLRDLGIRFALDDFGSGFSSLSYLKRLPFEQIKLDKAFIQDICSNPDDALIVHSVVGLGKALGLDVVAEGVENLNQKEQLDSLGCDSFQGYFFSPPLNLGAFEDYMHKLHFS